MLNKVLIADDHSLSRKGLALLIKSEWPMAQVIEASNGVEIIELYTKHSPDLILIDYKMPVMTGYEAAKKILTKNKSAKIILLTMFDTTAIALNFIKLGGRGFLSKGCNESDIIDCIRSVLNGDYYFSSDHEKEIIECIDNGLRQKLPKLKFSLLELEIVIKISQGMTNKEIGMALGLSIRTIETYRTDLIQKTMVKNSLELVAFAYENGIA